MSSSSVIKPLAGQELLEELNYFVDGATRNIKCSQLELARTALSLLKTLPAARDAILEYFCSIFDTAVSKYLKSLESSTGSINNFIPEENTIAEINTILCNFVRSNPTAWAPIISTWSLQLLGELSSRYAGRIHVPLSSLNETLQMWMSCRATRTLMDITTQCLSCLIHSDTEACIKALLDTSISHSPHFDWVVAQVGSCFPNTVITRVLSCGVKDFPQYGKLDQPDKNHKLTSVVGILSHLAGSHFIDIKNALHDLFKQSLEGDQGNEAIVATVPFLIQLSFLSDTLLKAFMKNVLELLTPSRLPLITDLAPKWCLYFRGKDPLIRLLIHLTLASQEGCMQILLLLLDACLETNSEEIQRTSKQILELLLQEIESLHHNLSQGNIPMLNGIKKDIVLIQPLLLERQPLKLQTAIRLIGIISYQSPQVLINSASLLIRKAVTEEQLTVFLKLVTIGSNNTINESNDYFLSQILSLGIKESKEDLDNDGKDQIWQNILTLLRWEESGLLLCSISAGMKDVVNELNEIVSLKEPYKHRIANILDLTLKPESLSSVQVALKLTNTFTFYFFECISEEDILIKTECVHRSVRLLSRLAHHSNSARSLIFRNILELALFHPVYKYLFGAEVENRRLANGSSNEEAYNLLENIHKQGASTLLAQTHSSIFHSGIIGNGPRRPVNKSSISKVTVIINTQFLIEVLNACISSEESSGANSEALASIALLLVELISPDVMYNGLPWPEEEFTKVTIERDLHIRRIFNQLPLSWELLRFAAWNRPALCYCSVLLRALTATLLSQWNSSYQQIQQDGTLLSTTVRLLEVMALGQLLPQPLASISEVVPVINPDQVIQLLRDCVWNYMRDHVPTPALFQKDNNGNVYRQDAFTSPGPQYTDTLRLIMQNNIEHFGDLYTQLFVNIEETTNN